MEKFNIGDKIKDKQFPYVYTVHKIDKQKGQYYIVSNDGFSVWSSCIGYEKVPKPDDVLRYGEVLTDDIYYVDGFNGGYHRIRIIQYDNSIFYYKMVNGEVVEFKELTV